MLRNASHLKGLVIRATDGELGTVDQIYFDSDSWTVRYLTVKTARWLGGRSVLISPYSILDVDWDAKRLDVRLTKKQVEDSPDFSTHLPVSRQQEAEHLGYYGYPHYWAGPNFWGTERSPLGVIPAAPVAQAVADIVRERQSQDSHLCSTAAAAGFNIEAIDGEIGHVEGFILDADAWVIRYMEVASRNWWPGKKVLISPAWIERVSWVDSAVFVALYRDAIKTAPEYIESRPIHRAYENQLYLHYGQPPYWFQPTSIQLPVTYDKDQLLTEP
jgi:hypothetical protein